jgi:hypothetical protein
MSGLLGFLNPWMLAALVALPALYWLLRLVPPLPERVHFPPLRLLLDVVPKQETAARTPWWLVALRLGMAALIILALAGPILNPAPPAPGGDGPVVLVVDAGWPAAPDWDRRVAALEKAIAAAEAAGREIALAPLTGRPEEISVATPAAARDALRALAPEPVTAERTPFIAPLERLAARNPGADFLWFADGVESGDARGFAEALVRLAGDRQPVIHLAQDTALALAGADNTPAALNVRVLRTGGDAVRSGTVRALDLRGRSLGETGFVFAPGESETRAAFELPIELRNEIARLELVDGRSAGGVQLLDERWRRRAVGLVSGTAADGAQPLLSPTYYVGRALEPFADIRPASSASPSDAVLRFIEDGLPVIAMTDVGTLSPDARTRLAEWVRAGGVLIRFAGTRLAAAEADDLLPVRLRRGGRVLGGALAWSEPQALGAFPAGSPYAGLAIPGDVRINRQVLAEPGPELADRTWAVLADGTPLVTARPEGSGLSVLFHITADTVWSNLPISGLFVDMLRATVALAGQSASTAADEAGATVEQTALSPTRTLDGYGAFRAPPPTARPVPAQGLPAANPDHPPGIYGPADGFLAVNTLAADATLRPLDLAGLAVERRTFTVSEPTPLAPGLLVAALIALIVDSLIVIALSGRLRGLHRRGATAAIVLVLGTLLMPPPAGAQTSDQIAMESALTTRLAFVRTGDADLDRRSEAGLRGLGYELAARTAFEPGEPVGVDPARDDLAFYPLIYWPIGDNAAPPGAEALSRIDAYMKRGGSILFDTRDALYVQGSGALPGQQALRRVLAGLDVPELEQVPADHVLTKAFYLLPGFPGRYADGALWVEATPDAEAVEGGEADPVRPGDGVSPIMITSNDLASAWAVDESGLPLYPTVPSDARQREMAYRAGINLVIYALTGNYKADQVHVPALLERLGQ